MAKIPMRVIPKPDDGTREVLRAEKHGGSTVISGTEGATSLLCGDCRDVLVKSVGPDEWVIHADDEQFTPLYRLRDIVFHCKGCGAYNEIPAP